MASAQKISELTTAGPLTGAELIPVVQNGGTLQTTVSAFVALANVSLLPVVSALQTQISQVSALTSVNEAAITSTNAVISVLDTRVAAVSASVASLNIQMAEVQASISAINSVLAAIDTSAIQALEGRVSVLEIRVSDVSVLVSANTASITSINAEVSLKANRNGDFLTNVQYIDFNTTTSYAPLPGRLTWDIESGTLDLGLTGTVNLLIGQRTVAQVYNNSGVTLPKGKAVRVTGAQGQRLTGALAQADSDADSLTIFGIMLETVSVNRSGYVATDGLIRNVNTIGYNDGDIVYLSPVSAGELTPTKPVAPQHLVQMGYIVNGGTAGAGEIYVKVQNGYELGELHDVKTSTSTSLADGEVLAYNVSAKVWSNSTALIDAQASISALNIQLAAVSARTSVNAAAITSTNNVVSALEIRVSAASATGAANTAAITSINNVVSALEIRVSSVSAAVSALNVRVAAVSASVSVLNVQMVQVIASISAINSVLATIDTAAITSINNVVSALEVRVSAVSATGVTNTAAITSINNVVSALEVRVSTVSAAVSAAFVSIGQRVLRAGDTMTGQLAIAVAANTIGVSVSGGLVVTSVVNFTGDSAVLLHSGTTATRPGSPTPGLIRFNSGSNTFEGYTSATWGAIGGGGGATGGGTNQVFYLNDQVVSVSYSIPAGKNAGSFGPITVASGVTVVVPTSSVWTIV